MSSKKPKRTNSVILTRQELEDLLQEVARLARVYATLGHYEDKETLYALIERFKERRDKK